MAGGGASLAWSRALAQPVFAEYPFQLGVAAGDPAPDGFVIWTRLAPRPLEPGHGMPAAPMAVEWEVASDSAFAQVVRKGEAIARPELGHSVHVEVAGLAPGRPYFYRFAAGRERSGVGRARTTPALGDKVARVRFGVVGCQSYEQGYYTAHRKVAGEELDFVYCYGDYIYEGRGSRLWNSPDGPRENPRQHLGGEMLASMAGFKWAHVPYKGCGDAIAGVLSGTVPVFISTYAHFAPQIKAGKLRGFVVTGAKRTQLAPEFPTVAESGYPGYDVDVWFGMVGSAKLPPAIISRLNAEVNKALAAPDMREKLAAGQYEPVGGTPERFGEVIRADIAKYGKVSRDVGVKAE